MELNTRLVLRLNAFTHKVDDGYLATFRGGEYVKRTADKIMSPAELGPFITANPHIAWEVQYT